MESAAEREKMVSAVSETLKEGKEFLQAEDQVPEKEVFPNALKGKDESYLQKVSKITRNMGRLTRLTHPKKARMAVMGWQILCICRTYIGICHWHQYPWCDPRV